MKLVDFVRLITNNEQRAYFEKEFVLDCNKTYIPQEMYETWLTKDLAKFFDEFLLLLNSFEDSGTANRIFAHYEIFERPELCFNFDGGIFRLTRM